MLVDRETTINIIFFSHPISQRRQSDKNRLQPSARTYAVARERPQGFPGRGFFTRPNTLSLTRRRGLALSLGRRKHPCCFLMACSWLLGRPDTGVDVAEKNHLVVKLSMPPVFLRKLSGMFSLNLSSTHESVRRRYLPLKSNELDKSSTEVHPEFKRPLVERGLAKKTVLDSSSASAPALRPDLARLSKLGCLADAYIIVAAIAEIPTLFSSNLDQVAVLFPGTKQLPHLLPHGL